MSEKSSGMAVSIVFATDVLMYMLIQVSDDVIRSDSYLSAQNPLFNTVIMFESHDYVDTHDSGFNFWLHSCVVYSHK